MALRYDSATLLDSIRQAAGLNSVQTDGNDDEDLLKLVNERMRDTVMPKLMQAREEYGIRSVRVALGSVSRYRIPHRAMGNKLRDLIYSDGSTRSYLPRIVREDIDLYTDPGSGTPDGWYLEGNYVQLVPIQGSYTGFLEMAFMVRPSLMVPIAETRTISALALSSKQVTLSATPPATFVDGAKIDIHSFESGAEIKLMDLTQVGAPAGSVITFLETIDGSSFGTMAPAVGDYACLAGESALPQIPEDMIPTLIGSVALFRIGADGDPKVQILGPLLTEQMKAADVLLSDRVEGRPRRVQGWRRQIQGWSP